MLFIRVANQGWEWKAGRENRLRGDRLFLGHIENGTLHRIRDLLYNVLSMDAWRRWTILSRAVSKALRKTKLFVFSEPVLILTVTNSMT